MGELIGMKEIIAAAKTEEGIWVIIIDLLASLFEEVNATGSTKEHVGRIRIHDKIEILEIINNLPQIHIYDPSEVDITEKNGKVQFSTRQWETEITYDGRKDREVYTNETLASIGTRKEKYTSIRGIPTIELLYPSPR